MKRKMFWGSVVVALLMLVSSQIVFLNAVKSDPTRHTGDAEVGDLWISELNVSSDLETIDYIGIGHVNATEDWVFWQDGIGNINASWSVEIEKNHPEYYIIYSLLVINVDDNCNETGNATFTKTYNEDTEYDEGGTLSIAVEFTEQQMQMEHQTLVCYLGASVRINNTIEAINFTVNAEDRCVLAVDFVEPQRLPPFSAYKEHANDEYPSRWSWIEGWDENFSSEEEMLDDQSIVISGDPQQPDMEWCGWHIAWIQIMQYKDKSIYNICPTGIIPEWEVNIPSQNVAQGRSYVNVTMNKLGGGEEITRTYRIRLVILHLNDNGKIGEGFKWVNSDVFPTDTVQKFCYDPTTDVYAGYKDGNNYVHCIGHIWCTRKKAGDQLFDQTFHKKLVDLKVKIVDDDGENQLDNTSYTQFAWQEKCAYLCGSYNITTTGTALISVDISEGLAKNEESVFTFSADRGDTKIELTV